jgi:protein O-GlcNAc transferase
MNNHEVWNELGNLYFMSGAYEPAIHAYLRSIQLENKFGRSYSNLALAFVHTGKYMDAIKLYRHSIDLLPNPKDRAITWNRLGILYRQIRDYKNALEAYQQADILDPQQKNAGHEMKLPLTVSMPVIDINSLLEETVPGIEVEKKFPPKEVDPNLMSTQVRATSHLLDDDLIPLDLEQIRRAVEDDIQAIEIPIVEEDKRNLVYINEKEFSENPSITEQEDDAKWNEVIKKKEGESGQNDKYSERFLPELTPEELRSIELDINKYKAETINNPRNVSAWERLGDAYKAAGMYKDAIQAIKTAIANNSTKPSYYYRLGLIYAAERKESDAVQAFEKVLELNPKHALAHASLGGYYRKLGMNELAQTHIKQALSTNFEDENEYNRACLEAICGNNDRAIELLQIALQTKQTYINWAKNDPDLDSLREDHRFKTLLSSYATI